MQATIQYDSQPLTKNLNSTLLSSKNEVQKQEQAPQLYGSFNPAMFTQQKEQSQEVLQLQKKLQSLQEKCDKLESKNESLKSTIWDMKKVIVRYALEEEHNLDKKDKKIEEQKETIEILKNAHTVLQRDGSHFKEVADFWEEHIANN